MKQVRITFFNPTSHSVDELRGALVKFDRQYFWLRLDDNRTVAIPTGFVVSATLLGTENMEGTDSPQQSALGSAMAEPIVKRTEG